MIFLSRQLSIVTVKDDEVRKAEKERMAFDKDLRAVSAAKAAVSAQAKISRAVKSGRGDAGRDGSRRSSRGARDDYDARDDYGGKDGGDGYKERKAGGKARKSPGPCYRCGQSGHKVEACSKPYVK